MSASPAPGHLLLTLSTLYLTSQEANSDPTMLLVNIICTIIVPSQSMFGLLSGHHQLEIRQAVLAVLSSLCRRPSAAFRPSLEHHVALLEALLAAPPPPDPGHEQSLKLSDTGATSGKRSKSAAKRTGCSTPAEPVAHGRGVDLAASSQHHALLLFTVSALQAQVTSAPNLKKVYTIVLSRLLAPLCAVAALSETGPSGSAGQLVGGSVEFHILESASAAKLLLLSSLFATEHIAGICAACATLAAPHFSGSAAQPSSASDIGTAVNSDVEQGASTAEKVKKAGKAQKADTAAEAPRSYHGQLFQALEGLLAAGPGEQHWQSALRLLPWLLQAFCAAIKRQRKMAAADAQAVASSKSRAGPKGKPTASLSAICF